MPVRLRWLLRFVLVISTQEFIFLYFLIIILTSIRANEYMSAVFMPKSRVALCFILIGNGGSSVQEWRQWGSRTATRIGREVKSEEKYPSVTRNRALSGTSDLAHVIQSDVWCQFLAWIIRSMESTVQNLLGILTLRCMNVFYVLIYIYLQILLPI